MNDIQLTAKKLKLFSYIVAISSMLTMSFTLLTVTFNGSARVIAPYGEAPLEVAILLFASGVLAYNFISELKGKKLTPQEQKHIAKKAKVFTVLFMLLGLFAILTAHSVTRYTLETYPKCAYEANPIMANIFSNYGYDTGLAYSICGYSLYAILSFFLIIKISNTQAYPFNLMLLFTLPMLSLMLFGTFSYNAYSDIKVLISVALRC